MLTVRGGEKTVKEVRDVVASNRKNISVSEKDVGDKVK